MTVTEAGACGTPAVATRIGGHEDAVLDGRSGLLVDSTDELASALDAVLRDEVLRKRLGHGALDRAAPAHLGCHGPGLTGRPGRRGALPPGLSGRPGVRPATRSAPVRGSPSAPCRVEAPLPGPQRHVDHTVGPQEHHAGPGPGAGLPNDCGQAPLSGATIWLWWTAT